MKIWHISDTHTYHELLTVPTDVDMVIHSGDISNYYDVYKNEPEALNFLHWYGNLKIPYKLLIAGNHDAYIAKMRTKFMEWCIHYNIIYLEDNGIEIESINFYGCPITPTFGTWYFMRARHKMDDYWKQVPDNTDVLISHGPPKGILDLTENYDRYVEQVGCKSMRRHVIERIKPKLCLFGHIHNVSDIVNAGTMKLSICDTIFSNGSVVTDREFGKLSSNGNILEI